MEKREKEQTNSDKAVSEEAASPTQSAPPQGRIMEPGKTCGICEASEGQICVC